MRYYQQSYSDGVAAGTNLGFTGGIAEATGGGASSPNTINLVRFPVEMRAAPSVTFYDSLGAVGKISTDGITNGVSSSSVDNLTTKVFKIFAAAVSRISFHYTANAEF
jgi:hypothetical protein